MCSIGKLVTLGKKIGTFLQSRMFQMLQLHKIKIKSIILLKVWPVLGYIIVISGCGFC